MQYFRANYFVCNQVYIPIRAELKAGATNIDIFISYIPPIHIMRGVPCQEAKVDVDYLYVYIRSAFGRHLGSALKGDVFFAHVVSPPARAKLQYQDGFTVQCIEDYEHSSNISSTKCIRVCILPYVLQNTANARAGPEWSDHPFRFRNSAGVRQRIKR